MSPKKKSADGADTAVLDAPRKAAAVHGRTRLLAAAVLVALACGLMVVVWQQVRDHVLSGGEYHLDPQAIAVTPAPAWVRSDIRAEVIREAGLKGPLSLLDEELTLRIATAFAAHPWVAHVERVSKRYPSGLDVILEYRKPVAMVEVQNDSALPVDAQGVVLPTADFLPGEPQRYPRIGEIHTTPSGPVGTRWGDPCVTGAAKIAAVLAGDWQSLGLYRIVPAGKKLARGGNEIHFAVLTRTGTKVVWGRAPSPEISGDLPADEKLASLKHYAAEHNGSLDGAKGAQELFFRENGELAAQPRPAIRSLPKSSP